MSIYELLLSIKQKILKYTKVSSFEQVIVTNTYVINVFDRHGDVWLSLSMKYSSNLLLSTLEVPPIIVLQSLEVVFMIKMSMALPKILDLPCKMVDCITRTSKITCIESSKL